VESAGTAPNPGGRGTVILGGDAMEHYSLEKWADFARQVIGEQERAAMQSHLENGCGKCSKVLSLWQHVHALARHERAYEPPESAVRSMKGSFAIRGPRKPGRAALAIVELLFDSSRSHVPLGVRSSGTASRQLLYGAGDYRIDLRIEPKVDSRGIAVVGQVLSSANPDEIVGALPITLVSGSKVLAESVTSPFGEFDVECDPKGPFELRVKLRTKELRLPLIEPLLREIEDHLEATVSKGINKSRPRNRIRTRKKA
jgi:hypothetical protein